MRIGEGGVPMRTGSHVRMAGRTRGRVGSVRDGVLPRIGASPSFMLYADESYVKVDKRLE